MFSLAHRLTSFPRWRWRLGAGVGAAALLLAGCTGAVGDPLADDGVEPGGGPGGAAEAQVAERSMFPRLSHAQWENTVRDLLRLDDRPGLSASFTSDPLGG